MPPRPLRPKDERIPVEPNDTASESQTGKRRTVSSACIPCRKRKSKCDGALPACSTCTAVYRTECNYDEDSDHRRKGALKRDIQSLQQRNDDLDVIVTSLRTLPEGESILLLHSLRSETNLNALARSLRNNVDLPQNFGHQTLEGEFTEQLSPLPNSLRCDNSVFSVSREDSGEDSERFPGAVSPAPKSNVWIKTRHNVDFIDHLLDLYFCWIHPFYQVFSREHFLRDMSRGRTEYCSVMLVNAVLAFACHYSEDPSARTDPSNPATAGDEFFAEAVRELQRTEPPSITTVQALAVMSIREISRGRDSSSYQYAGRSVRMVLELGLHLSILSNAFHPPENEVRKITFWGVFNFETFTSVFIGRPSQLPRAAADIHKPDMPTSNESQGRDRRDERDYSVVAGGEEQAFSMLLFHHITTLSELASDMASDFYTPRERFTSIRLAATYAKYQDWYRNLPDALRLEHGSPSSNVLILHMYYYGCVLHLFRPYIKLDLRTANLFPHEICTFCANEISKLVNSFRDLYGLRMVCLRVAPLLLSASTIHLLNMPAEEPVSHLRQAIQDLQAMSSNHQFAARCINILQSLASRWEIALPVDVISSTGYNQLPSASSSSFWSSSIPPETSFNNGPHLPTYTFHEPSAYQDPYSEQYLNDHSVDPDPIHAQNVLWTPFPSQTMPIPPQNFYPSIQSHSAVMADHNHHWSLAEGGGQVSGAQPAVDRMHGAASGNPRHAGRSEGWHWQ